jgi:uncharacterized membrane protein YcaP (DUF421 family)
VFFDHWESLVRIVLIGTFAYAGTVFLLRISGNRTLSKMNSFDLVVTIAFGSTLSTVLTDSQVSLAEGLAAIALLVVLQFLLTWLSVRSRSISLLVKTQPTILVKDGDFRKDAMRRIRVTEDEIRSAIRQHGLGGVEQVAAVVLETDGSMSVISIRLQGSLDALQGVQGQGKGG